MQQIQPEFRQQNLLRRQQTGKVGDLAGIRVHKFRFSRQEYLVAYRPSEKDTPMEFLIIDFYQVGSHENFYAKLEHYLRLKNSQGASK